MKYDFAIPEGILKARVLTDQTIGDACAFTLAAALEGFRKG